jgi:hypothetical protein
MISGDTTGGRRYHHNGDFSGDVHIVVSADEIDRDVFVGVQFFAVRLPMRDILEIAAAQVRQDRIGQIEQADARSLLGLPPG